MADLERATVFLSASFPSGERGEQFKPYDASGIADAVSAFSRAILGSNGTLAFGGHPTITPLVLMISRELRIKGSVIIFQSGWFEEQRLPEVDEIENEELGLVRWTPKVDDRDDSLRIMREEMIGYHAVRGGSLYRWNGRHRRRIRYGEGVVANDTMHASRRARWCGCGTSYERLGGAWSCSIRALASLPVYGAKVRGGTRRIVEPRQRVDIFGFSSAPVSDWRWLGGRKGQGGASS